jgi:beta-glucosidase
MSLDAGTLSQEGSVTASVTVTNTGDYDADEIVQLYIHDLEASVCRPVKELKGFQRIHLAKGESKEVTFKITPDMLKFYDARLDYVLEPGDFDIMIGPNSRDLQTVKLTVN